jgi:pyruvate/2-oxoglutarate dehydrogenase complex dihydrolipoamide dehydrogenase (E3) component
VTERLKVKESRESGAPADPFEADRLARVGPPRRGNPTPRGRYDLVVLGAGPSGLAAAESAATLGASVALVERKLLGGVNLNSATIPSKTLLRTTRLYADIAHARRYGARAAPVAPDFALAMSRLRHVRSHLSREDSVRRVESFGVDVFFGDGRFVAPDAVEVDGVRLAFARAVVATGASSVVSDIPGLVEAGFHTGETIFDLEDLPPRLVVIGGGPLGCELAQAFRRMGSAVTIVQDLPLFLDNEERDAAQLLSDAFARDGIEVRLNTTAQRVRVVDGLRLVDLRSDDYESTVAADAILTGMGRLPNVQDLGLEAAGIAFNAEHGIVVDDFLCSSNPRVYAAGDVCLAHKFTHTAVASARIVVRNALFGGRERMAELVVPWCTYTDPEIAHVGLYVREANRRGIAVKTFTIPMHEVARAVTDAEDMGFVKITVAEGSDRILGATIVARHAGEMINEISLAMGAGLGLRGLAKVIHSYPTQADAIRQAAQAYNHTRLTPRVRARLARSLRERLSNEEST